MRVRLPAMGRKARLMAITLVAASTGAASVALAAPAPASAAAGGTVIATSDGPFGPMLVVGSGKYAGYTAYMITSDAGGKFGCTSTIIKTLPQGPGSCTGPSNDQKAEWPAVTTVGAPVAGTGVTQSLLGSVARPGVGDQVTYAGHPLYLFDQMPGALSGEGWDEPTLPPWHGLWWVVSPSGQPQPWPEMLTTTTVGGKPVLAALMETGIGWERFPVYSYSKDTSTTSACTGACAVAWPPLISAGTPALVGSLSPSSLSTVKLSDGTNQLAYKGKPLYLFGYEAIAPVNGILSATGSGNGAKVGGGTFSLVTP
jgi:predicted lipoprotein with Yx(FWY)xxD motif